jgi:outer membrane receptor for ferrienterochelin and colicins
MKFPAIILIFLTALTTSASAQNSFTVILKDKESSRPLAGASVAIKSLQKGALADQNGVAMLTDLPSGQFAVEFSFVGYQGRTDTLSFPFSGSQPYTVLLIAEEEELEEVQITTTRSSRTIATIPTRVEAISGEELDEKGNMKPGDIRMLLNESTGIQTQQTSATSGNSSIRIQGLDGRYTQIIRDGFPLYSGFSGGLGLLQIAPLDLKQVEVIKGSTSTLYGGGAIAGLVNLVSKTPSEESELSFLLNGTSALGLDASGFYSHKPGHLGTTIYAAYNHGTPYDPSGIGLTAIPKFNRFTLNPAIFVDLSSNTTIRLGINASVEERTGGDIERIKADTRSGDGYFERNNTDRYSSQFSLNRKFANNASFTLKNSLSTYKRSISIPAFDFAGDQLSSFTEASYHYEKGDLEWIGGLNYITDRFREEKRADLILRDYNQNTTGAFLQNTWNASEQFTLESGVRGDYHNDYGFFLLPRISALYKKNAFSARLGGGLGYKTPTVFTEDAERIQFRNVMPIDASTARAERSYGGNFDVNFRKVLMDKISFSINQLFFYTRINDPLSLTAIPDNMYRFEQLDGYLDTRGMETNIKATYQDFKLFVGYTLADVKQHRNGMAAEYPLVARHRLNNVLMYEKEDRWKLGLEAYYYSPQALNEGSRGRSYWITGFMAEKLFERFSLFLNFENFLDTRQTRFDTIYTGNLSNPTFRDIYAPVDGFVVNGGIKFRL